jgi:gas vesicle protein
MSENDYESGVAGAGTALTCLLVGLSAGILVGMLFAPKPGKQLRKELRRKYKDAKDTFEDWSDEAKRFAEDAIDKGSAFANDVRERVEPIARNLRRS